MSSATIFKLPQPASDRGFYQGAALIVLSFALACAYGVFFLKPGGFGGGDGFGPFHRDVPQFGRHACLCPCHRTIGDQVELPAPTVPAVPK